jgi:hypothetical protein
VLNLLGAHPEITVQTIASAAIPNQNTEDGEKAAPHARRAVELCRILANRVTALLRLSPLSSPRSESDFAAIAVQGAPAAPRRLERAAD